MKVINYIGVVILILSIALSWIWFSWKLPLVIFLAIMGNNMERSKK